MPRVRGRPGVEFERMSAEHGQLRVGAERGAARDRRPARGGAGLRGSDRRPPRAVLRLPRAGASPRSFRSRAPTRRRDHDLPPRPATHRPVTAFLALLSAVLIGGADFVGGIASRTANGVRVAAFVAVAGLPLALVVSIAYGAERVTRSDVVWSVLAGVAVAVGIGCFYIGMGRGLISVVAPVAAVTGAVIPVAYAPRPGRAAGHDGADRSRDRVRRRRRRLARTLRAASRCRRRPERDRALARERRALRALLHRVLTGLRGGRALAGHDRAGRRRHRPRSARVRCWLAGRSPACAACSPPFS